MKLFASRMALVAVPFELGTDFLTVLVESWHSSIDPCRVVTEFDGAVQSVSYTHLTLPTILLV